MSAIISTSPVNSSIASNSATPVYATGNSKKIWLSIVALTLFSFVFASCGDGHEKKESDKRHPRCHGRPHRPGDGEGSYEFISVDSANKMIESYDISIGGSDSDLHSVVINADSLRAYLADTAIHDLKIMMAHTLSYINAGGNGQPCGYDYRDLTFVIAGYNSMGNYVYYPCGVPVTMMVIDHGMPCPYNCPSGNASNDILVAR